MGRQTLIKQLLCLGLLLISAKAQAQDYQSEFNKAFQEGDTSEQTKVLKAWEEADPENAELFTSYFNYYFFQSRQEVLSLTTTEPSGETLAITDSTGNTAGYISSGLGYNPAILKKGFDKIDEGISLYPNRLDMRFGKIYALAQIEEWERYTDEIIKSIKRSNENQNQWTWTNNVEQENGTEFFLLAIQDYQLNLYNTGDDKLLINMRTIAQEVLKYYPEHIESLSNLAITYLLTGEYDLGIEVLHRAEKINPEDSIVLGNIAQGYRMKGDKDMAIKYYNKVIEIGDESSIEFAKNQIEELMQ